jgi:hypothetical protein
MPLLIKFFELTDAKARMMGLPVKFQKRILRAAARAGATVIRKEYKRLLRTHRRSGSIEKSLGVIVRLYKDGNVTGYAGVRRGKEFKDRHGKRIVPGYYNHLVELGRRAFTRRMLRKNPYTPFRDGKPRYIPAAAGKYLLAKAIASSKAEVQSKVETVFVQKVEAEFAKQQALRLP